MNEKELDNIKLDLESMNVLYEQLKNVWRKRGAVREKIDELRVQEEKLTALSRLLQKKIGLFPGEDDYLTKPEGPDIFAETLDNVINP